MADNRNTSGGGDKPASPLPPIANPAVDGARPRRNYVLPWVLLGLALLALLAMLTQCGRDGEEARQDAIARDQAGQGEAVGPGAATTTAAGNYAQGSLAYDVNQHILSNARSEKTFTFGNLNFDSGSAEIRDVDRSDIVQLAEVLKAHPDARGAVVGYADARGSAGDNATLGGKRANAVIAALKQRGVDTRNIEARTGGELNEAASNSTAQGQAENRRTEFVLLGRS